ncbi:MAG: arginyltransferase [Helicobacteraceae bacterium]|jgi:arginine-tRNA-protein transferase|nr:arginyltransferase [Helicobacteraceae bacterium]
MALREFLGHTFVSQDKSCPYLLDRTSATQYHIGGVNSVMFAKLLSRGWRRFGRLFFRPVCAACDECKSARVDVDRFELSGSFRRILRKGEALRLEISRPIVSDDRLALYDRYHKERSISRGWETESADPTEYYCAFAESSEDYGYEFAYYYLDRLVCVALTDILPIGVSAVYCYYEPEMRSFSLGTYSVLRQAMFAKDRGAKRLYLGYWVQNNASLAYKARFKPFEILRGRPELDQTPIWE